MAVKHVVTASATVGPLSGQLTDIGGTEPSVSGPSALTSGGGSRSGITAPSILAKVDPVYPPSARQAGLEGTVMLKIQILTNGRSGEISVTRSSGYPALDEAAVAAVRQWQFVPAKDLNSGQAVTCTTTLPVSFRLHP